MLRKSLTVSCLSLIFGATLLLSGAGKKESPADLNLTDLEGKKVHLKDYRSKIVVLNFWATWCGPCKDEMPMFVDVEKVWAPKGVVFIGASLDDKKTAKAIPEFLQKYKIDFPVWTGTTLDDMDKLKMGEAVPDTAFLDEGGVIVARVEGEIKKSEILERLEWLTGDRKGPAPQALVRNLP
ncbi:MAG TPA: TlpA disulfide reductase family protein [Bryobacteraceae bacterium]|nr:TlpA disulfide reductase family protein [Bryobacteraceae bacterium]